MDLTAAFGLRPFTYPMAQELDLSYRVWRRLLPNLVRVRRGVYLTAWASDARTRHAQRTAAHVLTRTDHFAMGPSAACLLGLPKPFFHSWDRVPVTIAGPQTRSSRSIRRSCAAPVPTSWGPTTDLLDTAAVIAAELPLPQALMVTDAVARHLAGTSDRFRLAGEDCRAEVRRRLLDVADLPALRWANPAAESPAESFYRGHMILRGYEDPACGVPLSGESGAQYFADLIIGQLVIEVDGRDKYRDLAVLIAEKRREDDLRAAGNLFLRSFVDDLYADPGREMLRLDAKVHSLGRLALPA